MDVCALSYRQDYFCVLLTKTFWGNTKSCWILHNAKNRENYVCICDTWKKKGKLYKVVFFFPSSNSLSLFFSTIILLTHLFSSFTALLFRYSFYHTTFSNVQWWTLPPSIEEEQYSNTSHRAVGQNDELHRK